VGEILQDMILDSESAASLVRKDVILPQMIDIEQVPLPLLRLVTAAGDELTMVDHIKTTVSIQC